MDIFLNTFKKYDIQSKRYIHYYGRTNEYIGRYKFIDSEEVSRSESTSFANLLRLIYFCDANEIKRLLIDFYCNNLFTNMISYLIWYRKFDIANHFIKRCKIIDCNVAPNLIYDSKNFEYIKFFKKSFPNIIRSNNIVLMDRKIPTKLYISKNTVIFRKNNTSYLSTCRCIKDIAYGLIRLSKNDYTRYTNNTVYYRLLGTCVENYFKIN